MRFEIFQIVFFFQYLLGVGHPGSVSMFLPLSTTTKNRKAKKRQKKSKIKKRWWGGRVSGGEGVGPGFVVAHPASPIGPISQERPQHPHPLSKTYPKSADDRSADGKKL